MGGIASRTIVAALAGLLLGGACRQLNASHCGNQDGGATCLQRDASRPYCNLCVAANDGCVAEAEFEPECGGLGSTGAEPITSSTTAPASEGSTAAVSTDAVDSSSSGGPNLCGNGVIDEEAGEVCDGDALPEGMSCMTAGFGGGEIGCTEDCSTVDYTGCEMYTECGNDEVANGEECDGQNLNGNTCGDFPNLTGDGLTCTDRCALDTSGCMVCEEHGQPCDPMSDVCCDEGDICAGALSTTCCTQGTGQCIL